MVGQRWQPISVSIQVLREHYGLRFQIAAGREALEKRLQEAGVTLAIPRFILICLDDLQDHDNYLGEIKTQIPLLFGISSDLGIGYEFVDREGQPIHST